MNILKLLGIHFLKCTFTCNHAEQRKQAKWARKNTIFHPSNWITYLPQLNSFGHELENSKIFLVFKISLTIWQNSPTSSWSWGKITSPCQISGHHVQGWWQNQKIVHVQFLCCFNTNDDCFSQIDLQLLNILVELSLFHHWYFGDEWRYYVWKWHRLYVQKEHSIHNFAECQVQVHL